MNLTTGLTIALRPIIGMLILTFVVLPIKQFFDWLIPNSRFKRFLFREIGDKRGSRSWETALEVWRNSPSHSDWRRKR